MTYELLLCQNKRVIELEAKVAKLEALIDVNEAAIVTLYDVLHDKHLITESKFSRLSAEYLDLIHERREKQNEGSMRNVRRDENDHHGQN